MFGFQTANKPLKSIGCAALVAVHIFLLFTGKSYFLLSLIIFTFSFSCWLRQALLFVQELEPRYLLSFSNLL